MSQLNTTNKAAIPINDTDAQFVLNAENIAITLKNNNKNHDKNSGPTVFGTSLSNQFLLTILLTFLSS